MSGIALARAVFVVDIANTTFVDRTAIIGKAAIGLARTVETSGKEANANCFARTSRAIATFKRTVSPRWSGITKTVTEWTAVRIGGAGIANAFATASERKEYDDTAPQKVHHRGTILPTGRETSSFPISIYDVL